MAVSNIIGSLYQAQANLQVLVDGKFNRKHAWWWNPWFPVTFPTNRMNIRMVDYI